MLEALRRGANGWVLKPLLLLLVFAFIVWGVADVFTGSVRSTSVAKVGGTEISTEEFQRTYGNVLDNVGRRIGRRPTAEEARQRGFDRMTLEDMMNSMAVDEHARELDLALSQKAIVAQIEKDPTFQGAGGVFDSNAFNSFLRETGYNERGWLAYRRKEELRQQLTQPLFESVPVPAPLVAQVHAYREEARTLQFFSVTPEKAVKVAEPDDTQLKDTYAKEQRRFVTPEYRRLGMLLLSLDEIKRRLPVTDEDLRKAYDGDKDAQTIPERRKVQQIAFKDKAAAEAAAKAIAGGKSFLDIAKDNGATETDTDLGLNTKAQLFDPKIADAAFALAKDRVSAPVEGRFATVLVRVTEIVAGKTRTFDEMKQEIRDKLATGRINAEMRKLHDGVDDGRAAGKSLKDIAALFGPQSGAQYVEIPETDRAGRGKDGKPAYEGRDANALLNSGFDGKTGVESEGVDLADGGIGWVDVLGVTEGRQKPFEEVKADVIAAWKEQDATRQMIDFTSKLLERAKTETLTKLAAEAGGKLETSRSIKRTTEDSGLPAAAVQRAFALPLAGLASVDAGDGKRRMIFRVVKIEKAPPATKEQIEAVENQLRSERQQDAVQAYVGALRERYGATVNEANFKKAIGGGGDAR